jgi:hypothetical protein
MRAGWRLGNAHPRLHCLSDELSHNSRDQSGTHPDRRGQTLQASRLTTKINERQRIVDAEASRRFPCRRDSPLGTPTGPAGAAWQGKSCATG